MKTIAQLPLSILASTPALVSDFLESKVAYASSFLWNDIHIKNKIEEKKQQFSPESREVLHQVLRQQLQGFSLSSLQEKNVESLLFPNTFTLTTGHQLNLFSGPVFFIYKILQVIKSCSELQSRFPNHHFVPLFWMATEDHDFLEIQFFKTTTTTYSTHEKSGGAVGRIKITDLSFIDDFEKEFSDSPFGSSLIEMVKSTYVLGKTFAQATQKLVQILFSEWGLLMLDGDDALLKKQMTSIFRDEILGNKLLEQTQETVQFIKNKYGKVQVNPREINLFYLTETRNRIEWSNGNYKIVDTPMVFTQEEILAELQNFPERFSPNALLRPVYQEVVLPNIAYIGGNAEVAYWLQLPNYFQYLQLSFPILVPRNSMLFINEKNLNKIEKLNFKIQDFFKDKQQLVQQLLLENHPLSLEIEVLEKELMQNFIRLKEKANLTDKSFGPMLEAEQTRQLKSFDKMRKRLLKAEKIKQQEKMERLENIYSTIFPQNNWQERVYNFSVFYAIDGEDWIDNCLELISVDKSDLIIIAHSF